MAAKIQGCAAIIVIEPHAARRDLAVEFGATHVLDPADHPDLTASLRGMLGLVSVAKPGDLFPAEINKLMTFGHRVIGIIEGDSDPSTFISELFEHHRNGRLPFERMVTTYTLADIETAVRGEHEGRLHQGGAGIRDLTERRGRAPRSNRFAGR